MTAVPSTTSPTFWTSTCSGWATCTTARTLPAGVVPWSLPLEDRALLVAAYGRTNLTMRQLAPLFGVSKSVEARTRKRFAKDTVLIVDGTLVPTHDHTIAAQSKNYRYSTNHQVVIDADTRLVVVVGRSLAGNPTTARHGRNPVPRPPSARPSRSPTAVIPAPDCSSRTVANAARSSSRTGRRSTSGPTSGSVPASSTSSPA